MRKGKQAQKITRLHRNEAKAKVARPHPNPTLVSIKGYYHIEPYIMKPLHGIECLL